MTELIGQHLGRFEIQQEIGKGGMAQVYRAFDTKLGRAVALKVLATSLSLDPEFTKRFEREARLSANLRHPAIVKVYDVGEHQGFHYIAMELIEGRSLYAIIKQHGALGLGYAIPLLDPLCQALDYAHSQGAVHRDVKPHNVLVSIDGRVLLTDFGIAQPADADREGLTRTGTFIGTPEYISPEQLQSQRVDGRSDLYSLGITAYEIITGRVPFTGNTPQLIVAHTQTFPPPPSSIVPAIPGELDLIFARILAKNPQDRFSDGGVFSQSLRQVAQRYRIPIASESQIADLATKDSSVGRPTIVIEQGATPVAPHPSPAMVQPATIPISSDRPPESPPPLPRPQPHPSSTDDSLLQSEKKHKQKSFAWVAMLSVVGVLIFIAMLMFFLQNRKGATNTSPTAVSPNPTIITNVPIFAEPPVVPQPTYTPESLAVPSETPTTVPREPTTVPREPTNAPEAPTNTPEAPTNIPIEPTKTLTSIPTDTPTMTVTISAYPIPQPTASYPEATPS